MSITIEAALKEYYPKATEAFKSPIQRIKTWYIEDYNDPIPDYAYRMMQMTKAGFTPTQISEIFDRSINVVNYYTRRKNRLTLF